MRRSGSFERAKLSLKVVLKQKKKKKKKIEKEKQKKARKTLKMITKFSINK